MENIFNIIAIVLSVLSFGVSFVSVLISKIKRPVIFEADNVEIIDNYAMLFSVDGKALDEIMAKCVNYNNQDVLLYLQDGQVAVRNEEKNKVELYQVKKTYYTAKANSVSEFQIKIDIGSKKDTGSNEWTYLNFKYHNGIRMKTFVYKEEREIGRND